MTITILDIMKNNNAFLLDLEERINRVSSYYHEELKSVRTIFYRENRFPKNTETIYFENIIDLSKTEISMAIYANSDYLNYIFKLEALSDDYKKYVADLIAHYKKEDEAEEKRNAKLKKDIAEKELVEFKRLKAKYE